MEIYVIGVLFTFLALVVVGAPIFIAMGVSATLINDGSKSYLLLTAKGTGTEASV